MTYSRQQKIWHLTPVNKDVGPWQGIFGCVFGVVVRAPTEQAARMIASQQAGLEGASAWTDPALSECVELTQAGRHGLIIQDCRYG